MRSLAWIGRLVAGAYFIFNGLNHFFNARMLASYAAAKGVPAPELLVVCAGVLILLGGISLILGLWPKVGVGMIVLFLVIVTPAMHTYWNETGMQRTEDFINFTKNLALLGAVLSLLAIPEPWPASVRVPLPGVRKRVHA